ncbi:sigma-54-dependent Fis family transcriptional regulator [Geopsychrobacter electrodiphilus]|uniref:sigma-54-dependent Fis family transcriptional regulator n=1 Tax=Geopsychrobacter electrodiphilus TaxID=225196 RepID=UPI0003731F70|nr:sigma-54-dependent Fis family transcriptional regulator [Geopsychrobacter electrodiphilus]
MGFAQVAERAGYNLDGVTPLEESWLAVLDSEQRIITSNEECFALLARRPEELIGQRLGQVIKLGFLHTLLVQGVCFKSQPVWINNVKHYCDYTSLGKDPQLSAGLFSLMRSEQLTTSSLEMPDLLCSMDQGSTLTQESLILVNTDCIITMINQPFADVLGLRAGELLGKHVHKAYPNSNPSRLPVVMDTGQAEVAEPHLLNGRQTVVSRYPLFKEGKMLGAWGKVLFSDMRELTRIADKFQNFTPSSSAPKSRGQSSGLSFKYDCNSIIGHSKRMKDLKEKLLRIAERPSNVLLMGESGTGKELFAHALHAASKRRYGPFVRVNCAAIPDLLLESELFGYTDGAFTGAKKGGQIGKFELADGGTIFLDEISDMPMIMQAKLLRVLQEREVTPLGSTATKRIDIRVVAATNVNLEEKVRNGLFRTDLYYRLNVIALEIPALRERRDDIYFITKHLIDDFNAEFEMNIQGLDEEAWQLLKNYDFPGNIRELRNAIESAFNMATGTRIEAGDLPRHIRGASPSAVSPLDSSQQENLLSCIGQKPLQEIMDEMERLLIEASLTQSGGNKLNAASVLGISRPGLYKKLHKYHLQ